MSWRYVFDGNKKHWGHIDNLLKVVKITGYKFFTWNDCVYEALDGKDYKMLWEFKVEDLV